MSNERAHREVASAEHRSVIDASTQLVDVRQPNEFAAGTLDGFVNIPLDQLEQRVDELDPQRRVVLLCRSGNRSGTAARFLTAHGFGDVVNLAGGMLAVGTRQG